jgi:CheY-like chemotaxis protein
LEVTQSFIQSASEVRERWTTLFLSRLAMISVLCVDDDSDHLFLEKISLEEPGVLTVTTALSAREALKNMETTRFDAVVADYQMPGMDGIGLLRMVHAANPGLPFILYTRQEQEEIVFQAFNSDAEYYLQKNGELMVEFARLRDMIFKSVKTEAV